MAESIEAIFTRVTKAMQTEEKSKNHARQAEAIRWQKLQARRSKMDPWDFLNEVREFIQSQMMYGWDKEEQILKAEIDRTRPANVTKRLFDVDIFPMAEKMWLDQQFRGVRAYTAEDAILLVLDRARKGIKARMLEIVKDKSDHRICKATVHVAEVVGKKQDKVLETEEFEYNV